MGGDDLSVGQGDVRQKPLVPFDQRRGQKFCLKLHIFGL